MDQNLYQSYLIMFPNSVLMCVCVRVHAYIYIHTQMHNGRDAGHRRLVKKHKGFHMEVTGSSNSDTDLK